MRNLICMVVILFSFSSCWKERERLATQNYIESKVKAGVERRKSEFLQRCRDEHLVIAGRKADSVLRVLIFRSLDTLSRPVRPVKPVRPGFEPANKDVELKPIVEDELLDWLKTYETFIVGDTSFLRLYLDSILHRNIDSLFLDSLYRDSVYFDSLFNAEKQKIKKK